VNYITPPPQTTQTAPDGATAVQMHTNGTHNGQVAAPLTNTEKISRHILTALDAIDDTPGAAFELTVKRRKYGKNVMDKGYYSDRQALALEAATRTQKPDAIAVYVTLQEIHPDCLHRARNKMPGDVAAVGMADVTRYRNLLIDVDRAGIKEISATDAEKQDIRAALTAIKESLLESGWPDPAFEGDSGNGGHICWKIDLPATRETQELIKHCYQAIGQQFNTAALSVDASLADPNQLIKLYGTKTRKGDDTPERPHRFSQLLHTYETEPVTLEQLQQLADLYKPPASPTHQTTNKELDKTKYWKASTPETVEAWAAGHGLTLSTRTKDSHQQTGDGWKWRVDCLTSDEHKDGAVLILNGRGNLKFKCQHNSCSEKDIGDVLTKYPKPHSDPERDKKAGPTWAEYTEAVETLGYSVRMNELDDIVEVNGQPLNDGLEAEILMRMADTGYPKNQWVSRAILATAHQQRYHPVKDFLNDIKWDGQDWIARLEKHVIDKHPRIIYDNGNILPVFGAFLRRWGIGAVGKVLGGGAVRVQNSMLVLVGAQDLGKSTLARFLCPMSDNFFIESHIEPGNHDHDRYLATKLVWEVGELGATTRKADREMLKAFLTRQDVTFRVPYAKHPITKPAMSSFIGTINPETGFLNDPTGHRRYLPVELTRIEQGYVKTINPEQLWAQFVALYRAGESARLTPEETLMADAIREGQETEDAYAGFIAKFYDLDLAQTSTAKRMPGWNETTTDIVEQLTINGVAGVNVTNVGLSLKKLGLTSDRRQVKGIREIRWYGLCRNNMGDKVRR